jgi:hypothetical protein
MTNVVDFDRRKPKPTNLVFEASNPHDWTDQHILFCFQSENETGVCVGFIQETTRIFRDHMYLNADQCEEFGNALLEAARIGRETEGKRR